MSAPTLLEFLAYHEVHDEPAEFAGTPRDAGRAQGYAEALRDLRIHVLEGHPLPVDGEEVDRGA